ncbi:glycoside hydrolase family 18 protein [Pseudoduganella sp. SL102]|uniref:glycoside hydrolase family 18 protein n=1 Tax=Pseudoduganella sp. SL102 TaxID=2995154 RepID=UPI00248C186F|nr:glycoside hydrolase family 18 protein [Pseudoduganella sp. SL102]WBS05224.1 glycoside hydrolase family 18 protein [Pseudoduganella sp. SL102]
MSSSIPLRRLSIFCAAAMLVASAAPSAAGSDKNYQVGSYYTGWSVDKGFRLKQFDRSPAADGFTFLVYAFENIYPMPDGSHRCDSGRDVPDRDGAGMRATLDYARRFGAGESVDGSADKPGQPLAGNFHQLAQLKARRPNLKVLVALGGGEWSRWFAPGAATEEGRRALVSSCIDLYLRGNLPHLDGHGGPGAAAGVFDGIDLDWEHPGPADKGNFTLLVQELRRQLDALGKETGKRYLLTAAVNSTDEKMRHTEPAVYSRSLDWINLMTYDFNGAWNAQGPTGFQSNLYPDPASKDASPRSVDTGVKRFLAAGVPPEKIVVGVPFYARGWRGVAPANNGLYQPAQGAARGFEEGAEEYARIAARKLPGQYHPVTRQWWTYADGTFWTYDDPRVIEEKAGYVRTRRLGGLMSWALDQDDAAFSLSRAMTTLRRAP